MFRMKLEKNRVLLVENADFRHFRDYLIQEDLITWMEIETIEAERTRYQQIGRLLDIMRSKPDLASEQFLDIVRKTDRILYSQFNLFLSQDDLQLSDHAIKHENGSSSNLTNGPLDDLGAIQSELQDWYINTLSRLHPIPWCEWLELDLDHVFTNLEIIQARKHQLRQRLKSECDDMQSLDSMFSSDSKRNVCFVEGPAGIGKSTLCRRVVYLWSKDNFSIHGHSFDLAFLLEAHSLTGDLKKCMNEQLFPEDFEVSEDKIYQCVQKNQHKVLLIVDGVDELSPEGKITVIKLLKGDKLRHVHLLLTGRPEASREFIKYANSHLKLKGFSVQNVEAYICKYFGSEDKHFKNELLNRLKSDFQLQRIVTNPFTTLLVCLLVQDNEGDIPANSIAIQNQVLRASCRNYVAKKKESGDTFCTEENLFSAAGHLAYNGLRQGISVFPERTFASFCPDGFSEHLLKSGILNKDFTVSRLYTRGFCYFPHKSFQELLCAKHLAELSVRELEAKLEPLTMSYGLDVNMYRLLLGMLQCQVKIKVVLESLCQKVDKMNNTRQVAIAEALRWVLLLFFDINPNEDLLEFLTEKISTCDQIVRAICYGSLYGYWAGELLPCIQRAIRKMKFPPVIDVLDPRLTLKTVDKQTGDFSYFLRKDQQLRTVTEVHVPRHRELLTLSKGPSSLSATELSHTTWTFVHCSSVKTANDILTKSMEGNVLSILLIPGNDSMGDFTAMLKCINAAKKKFLVLLLVLEELNNDYTFLRMLSLFSHLENISFLNLKSSYIDSKKDPTIQNGSLLVSNRKYVFHSSINQMYYSKFCPY